MDARVPIPELGHEDVAIIQSLLMAAGFTFHVHEGFGEVPDVIFVERSDLESVKEFLAEYEMRAPSGAKVRIPW